MKIALVSLLQRMSLISLYFSAINVMAFSQPGKPLSQLKIKDGDTILGHLEDLRHHKSGINWYKFPFINAKGNDELEW